MADHAALSLDNGNAGPINTLSAVTLPKGRSALSVQTQYILNNEISIEELERFAMDDEDIHSTSSLLNIAVNGAYAFNDKLSVGFSLPYIERGNLIETAHGHEEIEDHHGDENKGEPHEGESDEERVIAQGDINGIGDATFFGQYRFLSNADMNMHAALIFGIKVPTGKTNRRNKENELFETEHQPGTGSWDTVFGLAYTKNWGHLAMNTNILYSAVSDGSQDTNIGDAFYYNLAFSYRFAKSAVSHHHDSDEAGFDHEHHDNIEYIPDNFSKYWEIIVELNGDWRDKVMVGNEVENHTGGNIVYLNSGFRYGIGHGWSANFSLGIPVVENLNGIQSEPDIRFFAGINKGF